MLKSFYKTNYIGLEVDRLCVRIFIAELSWKSILKRQQKHCVRCSGYQQDIAVKSKLRLDFKLSSL